MEIIMPIHVKVLSLHHVSLLKFYIMSRSKHSKVFRCSTIVQRLPYVEDVVFNLLEKERSLNRNWIIERHDEGRFVSVCRYLVPGMLSSVDLGILHECYPDGWVSVRNGVCYFNIDVSCDED